MNYFMFPGMPRPKKATEPKVPKDLKESWVDPFKVQTTVLKYFGFTLIQVIDKARTSELVEARHILIYFLWKRTRLTKGELSRLLEKNHSTLINAINSIQDAVEASDEMSKKINKIHKLI